MCEQGVAPYVAQSAPKVNFNVGSEYMATARPMDPPRERCEPRRPRGNDFGPKPGTADESWEPTRRSTLRRTKCAEGELQRWELMK